MTLKNTVPTMKINSPLFASRINPTRVGHTRFTGGSLGGKSIRLHEEAYAPDANNHFSSPDVPTLNSYT
jgi:hypothetical protein